LNKTSQVENAEKIVPGIPCFPRAEGQVFNIAFVMFSYFHRNGLLEMLKIAKALEKIK
jgi:hypothetical protein